MGVKGYKRYFSLFRNIKNPGIYLRNKIIPSIKPFLFITKPNEIRITVSKKLLLVFKEIFMSDVYDIDALCKVLPSNPVILDIGANVGFFDVILLSKINVSRIFAYEPVTVNSNKFQEIINDNDILKQKVSLYTMAVTGKPVDKLELHIQGDNENTVDASVLSEFKKDHNTTITVPCITLGEILQKNNLSKVDLLKMDCEGSEYDIMYNTDPELIKRITKMVIEVHDIDNEKNNVSFFNDYTKSLGYLTSYEKIDVDCYILHATRTIFNGTVEQR